MSLSATSLHGWYVSIGSSYFFFQAEDGIRDLVRSRGLGDVYKRQGKDYALVGRTDGTSFVDVTDPARPRYLITEPGVGYRLRVDVEDAGVE